MEDLPPYASPLHDGFIRSAREFRGNSGARAALGSGAIGRVKSMFCTFSLLSLKNVVNLFAVIIYITVIRNHPNVLALLQKSYRLRKDVM